jgi:hypothetical protein
MEKYEQNKDLLGPDGEFQYPAFSLRKATHKVQPFASIEELGRKRKPASEPVFKQGMEEYETGAVVSLTNNNA